MFFASPPADGGTAEVVPVVPSTGDKFPNNIHKEDE
jgi:hypothetical protein